MIEIKSVDYTKCDKLYEAIDTLSSANKYCRYTHNFATQAINKALNEVGDELTKALLEVNSRLDIWSKNLNHYYKMHGKKVAEYGATYEFTKFIFPYRVIKENSTLWLLEVNPDDDYHGGIRDCSYTVDENWNYDITLEEITKEEFFKEAVKSVEHVYNRRMDRIKFEEDNVVN